MTIERTEVEAKTPLPGRFKIESIDRTPSQVRVSFLQDMQTIRRRTVATLTSTETDILIGEYFTTYREQPTVTEINALIEAGLMCVYTIGPGTPAAYATYRATWLGTRLADSIKANET